MKTKKAMKPYTCYLCKGTIEKGQQYAKKSITIGYYGTWGHGKAMVSRQWCVSPDNRPCRSECDPEGGGQRLC